MSYDEIEKARKIIREQGPIILFDPDRYRLHQRLDVLLKKNNPEILKQYLKTDREQVLFEAFSMIEEFRRGKLHPSEYLATWLFSTYVLSSQGGASE